MKRAVECIEGSKCGKRWEISPKRGKACPPPPGREREGRESKRRLWDLVATAVGRLANPNEESMPHAKSLGRKQIKAKRKLAFAKALWQNGGRMSEALPKPLQIIPSFFPHQSHRYVGNQGLNISAIMPPELKGQGSGFPATLVPRKPTAKAYGKRNTNLNNADETLHGACEKHGAVGLVGDCDLNELCGSIIEQHGNGALSAGKEGERKYADRQSGRGDQHRRRGRQAAGKQGAN